MGVFVCMCVRSVKAMRVLLYRRSYNQCMVKVDKDNHIETDILHPQSIGLLELNVHCASNSFPIRHMQRVCVFCNQISLQIAIGPTMIVVKTSTVSDQ